MTTGIVVPCGKCLICQTNRAATWSMRLVHELQTNPIGCFITLTYDDVHVPYFQDGLLTLYKDDITRWLKRFRKNKPKIKYYLVGEYGSITSRPHYHAVIFGWTPDTKSLIPGPNGTWSLDDSLWSYGSVQIGSLTNDSIYYVAGYLLKSTLYKKNLYGRTAPFLRVSKGLGLDYALIHQDKIREMKITAEGKTAPLPRYYLKKISGIKRENVEVTTYQRQVAVLQKIIHKEKSLPPDLIEQAQALVLLSRLQSEKDVKALKKALCGKRYKV